MLRGTRVMAHVYDHMTQSHFNFNPCGHIGVME
jgi:hypothetical protein